MLLKLRQNRRGFTIIELMIATSVFSLILLVVAAGSLQIGRLFYKGFSGARAQTAAREIIEEVARAIQFGGSDPTAVTTVSVPPSGMPVSYFCIDNIRYSFAVDVRNAAFGGYTGGADARAPHVMFRDKLPSPADCTGPANLACSDPNGGPPGCTPSVGTDGQELMPYNMKLTEFSLAQAPGSTGSRFWCLRLGIAFGENDIHVRGDTQDCLGNTVPNRVIRCVESNRGGHFCGVSKLHTTIQRRLR